MSEQQSGPVAQLIERIRNISNNTPPSDRPNNTPPSDRRQTSVGQQRDGHNREVDDNNPTVADAFFNGVVYDHVLGTPWGQYP